MPLIFRSMQADGNLPRIGSDSSSLGVRTGTDEEQPSDIPVEDNRVRPGTGGMSVAPSARLLPIHKIPKQFRARYPGARGSNKLICWRTGDGPFIAGPLAAGLQFRNDPERPTEHGFVEPAAEMPLTAYQDALAATQPSWQSVPWVEEGQTEEAKS
jgi:hypothetical protein